MCATRKGAIASIRRPIAPRSPASARRSGTGWCCRSPASRSAAIRPPSRGPPCLGPIRRRCRWRCASLRPRRPTRRTSATSWASSGRCASTRRSSFTPQPRRSAWARWLKQGLIPFDKLSVLYALGRFALTRTAIPRDLLPFLAPEAPRFHAWSVCAFGRRETACVTAAALLGGHARVGFENNLALPSGERAASNADLVGAAAHGAGSGRPSDPDRGRLAGGGRGGDGLVIASAAGRRAARIAFYRMGRENKKKANETERVFFSFLLLSFTFRN